MKEGSGSGSRRTDLRKALGREGEERAAAYLEGMGLRILHRNWRARSGEIDVVAEDGEVLVFVEVRTRRSTGRFGTPEESVDPRKQRQVRETALLYLHAAGQHHRKIRFDVVAVTFSPEDGAPVVRHIPAAF